MPKFMSIRSAALCLGVVAGSVQAAGAAEIFDELRFGGLASFDSGSREQGMFIQGMVLFDPWDRESMSGWQRTLTPRIHVGGDIATANEADQIYAGFSWTTDINDLFFVEAGFGGSLNNGRLDWPDVDDGTPVVGSHLLFHEYAALGINIDKNWRVIAQIEHSSHAELADGANQGLSRAGVLIGYKF